MCFYLYTYNIAVFDHNNVKLQISTLFMKSSAVSVKFVCKRYVDRNEVFTVLWFAEIIDAT